MIKVKGYTPVDYLTFQGIIFDTYKRSKKTHMEVAQGVGARSTQTSVNAISSKTPMVSDAFLTKVMNVLNMDGFVLTHNGTKYYYIKG